MYLGCGHFLVHLPAAARHLVQRLTEGRPTDACTLTALDEQSGHAALLPLRTNSPRLRTALDAPHQPLTNQASSAVLLHQRGGHMHLREHFRAAPPIALKPPPVLQSAHRPPLTKLGGGTRPALAPGTRPPEETVPCTRPRPTEQAVPDATRLLARLLLCNATLHGEQLRVGQLAVCSQILDGGEHIALQSVSQSASQSVSK